MTLKPQTTNSRRRVALLALFLISVECGYSMDTPKKFSVGFAIPVYSTFFYPSVPGNASESPSPKTLSGAIMSVIDTWFCYYIEDSDYLKINFGFNADIVPAGDPIWALVHDYTGTAFGTLVMYSSVKYMREVGLGVNLGLGIGMARNSLSRTDWTNGTAVRTDLGSMDLLLPLEVNWGILYLSYLPTFFKVEKDRGSFQYSHLVSVELGGNFAF